MLPATTIRPGTRRPTVGEWESPDLLDLIADLHPAWHSLGLCRESDLDWFPDRHGNGSQMDEVKALCRSCPVKAECLDAALSDLTLAGIWGGTSHRERRRMQRQ